MSGRIKALCATLLLAMLVVFHAGPAVAGEDLVWRVTKSSGEVSVTTAAGDHSALIAGATLKPGDSIRTGQNGRALLMRGAETILVSPNSAIGIPKERKDGMATTIIHQSGSILLDVEKRNVKHFEVETPYLAAVVKGTQFRVTVEQGAARVDVVRGQVEVTDFKSGQFAMVQPGQAAQVSAVSAGLSLSGSGTLNPVQQGTPRLASISPLQALTETAAAPEKKPAGPQARAVSAQIDSEWMRSSPRSPAQDSKWSFGLEFPSRIFGGSHGRATQTEDIYVALAFSLAIGGAVAIAVGAQRRRKSRNTIQS